MCSSLFLFSAGQNMDMLTVCEYEPAIFDTKHLGYCILVNAGDSGKSKETEKKIRVIDTMWLHSDLGPPISVLKEENMVPIYIRTY
jgi:hypothetical protein